MRPRISVVMPVLNGERFVAQAIESILGQTFGDLEFIVVNDGSTDDTGDVLDVYARRDRRIRILNPPCHQGIAGASNIGYRASSASLIARMDADDASKPERLERQVRFLEDHPDVGVVSCRVQVIDLDGRPGPTWPSPAEPGLIAWTLMFYCAVSNSAAVFRRSILKPDEWYPQGYEAEDYALFVRLARSTRLASLSEVLHQYRTWGESYTNSNWDRLEDDSIRIVREALRPVVGDVPARDLRALRELARHRYPLLPRDIAGAAATIDCLRRYVTGLAPLVERDRREIDEDAGVRLWLLAALAARAGAPGLAVRIVTQACRTSATSGVQFLRKALRRSRENWTRRSG